MHRLVILASVAVLAAGSVNCANSGDRANPASEILPSPSIAAPPVGADGKAPSGGGGATTFELLMYTDVNGNTLPNWGDTVTFKVSTTATTQPQVKLQCSQKGNLVYNAYTAFYDGYPWPWTQYMLLSSEAWTSGAADCTATLYYTSGRKTITLKPLTFTAGA